MSGFPKGTVVDLINNEKIVILEMIGSGGTADIYKVYNLQRKCYQCAKHLYGNYSAEPKKYYDKLRILSKMSKPHDLFVWSYPDACSRFDEKSRSFLFVMELLEGYKDLRSIMKNPDILPLKTRIRICLKLAEAADAAIEHSLIYGDWQSKNVMWKKMPSGEISLKIIDTDGMSLPGHHLGLQGTGKYRAPEILAGGSQTEQSDIHALATVAFRLLCGRHPLDGRLTRSETETPASIMKYYCHKPLFIFDGYENEPSELVKERFSRLPRILQLLYRQYFSNRCLMGREDRPDYSVFKIAHEQAIKVI